MERTPSRDITPIFFPRSEYTDTTEEKVGINLGADFCSEHEWGITPIREAFGLKKNSGLMGLAARQIKQLPGLQGLLHPMFDGTPRDPKSLWRIPSLVLADHDGMLTLAFIPAYRDTALFDAVVEQCSEQNRVVRVVEDVLPPNIKVNQHCWGSDKKLPFNAAWDKEGFMVCSRDEKGRKLIAKLADAFDRLDIVISLGGQSTFIDNAGLCFTIASKLPKQLVKGLHDMDEDAVWLKQKALETGIAERLEKANLRYYALSPRWEDKQKKSVIFWLNPMQQDQYNCGWMTVADLDNWIAGKGKVIKVPAYTHA